MNSQSYHGFQYPEEILKVSKNKAVVLRALIQNIYIQMQQNLEKSTGNYKNDLEMVTELILDFVENSNLSLMYISDKLTAEEMSRRGRQVNDQSQYDQVDQNMMFNDPGSGGSPNTKSISMKSSIEPSVFSNSHLSYSIPPVKKQPLISFSQQNINEQDGTPQFTYNQTTSEQRYVEIVESCKFLVQDKFLKNLISPEPSLTKKI